MIRCLQTLNPYHLTLEPDDHDDVQVLVFMRMWSSFEAEFISLRDRNGKHLM